MFIDYYRIETLGVFPCPFGSSTWCFHISGNGKRALQTETHTNPTTHTITQSNITPYIPLYAYNLHVAYANMSFVLKTFAFLSNFGFTYVYIFDLICKVRYVDYIFFCIICMECVHVLNITWSDMLTATVGAQDGTASRPSETLTRALRRVILSNISDGNEKAIWNASAKCSYMAWLLDFRWLIRICYFSL